MHHLPPSIVAFLIPFRIIFCLNKSFLKMFLLFTGSVACRGGRTVCGCLRALGMHGETAFANYHHLLSRSKIDMLHGVKILIEMILPLTGPSVILVVDEHLERRRGEKIKAKATYRDPVASSRSWLVKCTGLKWVILAILVTFPWSKRPFALPVFCVLRTPEDHPRNTKRSMRSGTKILCQMLMVIRRWFPNLTLTLLGDGDYARAHLCVVCQRLSIGIVTRLRADARLHAIPCETKRSGRRARLGPRLTRPEPSFWQKMNIPWYGGQYKDVLIASMDCLWKAGKECALIPLRTVWVQTRPEDEMVLMTTDFCMDSLKVIERYISRWNIEVTFREAREYLGVETQRQWSDSAIERTTPLLFVLYTLITLIGNKIYGQKGILVESTAWYQKTHATFSDLLEAVRLELGNVDRIVNSVLSTEFEKPGWKNTPSGEPLVAG